MLSNLGVSDLTYPKHFFIAYNKICEPLITCRLVIHKYANESIITDISKVFSILNN